MSSVVSIIDIHHGSYKLIKTLHLTKMFWLIATEVFRKVEGCVKLQVEVQSTMTTTAEHVHCSINVISGHG